MKRAAKALAFASALLAASAAFAADDVVKSVTAHVADQASAQRNDPKWLNESSFVGQTFVPGSDSMSFIHVNAFAAVKAGNGCVNRCESDGTSNLSMKIWEFGGSVDDAKAAKPVASAEAIVPLTLAKTEFFELPCVLTPGQPYYLELSETSPTGRHYYYWYQYNGNPYSKGSFYMRGKEWPASDLEFATYHPVKLEGKTALSAMPEIFEIRFARNMDKTKVSAYLSGPSGVVKTEKTWKGEDTLFLGPVKLPEYDGKEANLTLYVNYFDSEDGAAKKHAQQITVKKQE